MPSEIEILKEAIDNAGYEYRSYSGRGMYGDKCLGFTTDRDTSPLRAVAEVMAEISEILSGYDEDEIDFDIHYFADDVFHNVKEDSMGMGTIIYFPNVKWEDDAEDDFGENEGVSND